MLHPQTVIAGRQVVRQDQQPSRRSRGCEAARRAPFPRPSARRRRGRSGRSIRPRVRAEAEHHRRGPAVPGHEDRLDHALGQLLPPLLQRLGHVVHALQGSAEGAQHRQQRLRPRLDVAAQGVVVGGLDPVEAGQLPQIVQPVIQHHSPLPRIWRIPCSGIRTQPGRLFSS